MVFEVSGLDYRKLLLDSFAAALAAADPLKVVPGYLPAPPRGKTLVVGAGKASAAIALAVERHWPKGKELDGIVITRHGHAVPTSRIKIVEAGHPIPSEEGQAAAVDILKRAGELGSDDLLLVLVSGGGSSLMSVPVEAITMDDLKTLTAALLKSGADIREINVVRKHLSAIHGGRLAAATRAKVVALIISDVTDDDPASIASGPCAPDPTTYRDAIDILARYEITAPAAIRAHLADGAVGKIAETPKPDDHRFASVENHIIANAQSALAASAAFFASHQFPAHVLSASITGEARDVAKVQAAMVRQIRRYHQPWNAPVALISGGECTVTVKGDGRGGRCSEFLLSLGIECRDSAGLYAIACDTDGIDGSEDNAGAILTIDSWRRADALRLDAAHYLARNDSYSFFQALDDLVITGPTRTNVNDYRCILLS